MKEKTIEPYSTSQVRIDTQMKLAIKKYAAEINQPMRYVVEEMFRIHFAPEILKNSDLRRTKTENEPEDV